MKLLPAVLSITAGGAPSTAVMTTNVTRFTMDLGQVLLGRDPDNVAETRRRASHTWPAMVGFAVGCCLGAACETALGLWSLAFPSGLALLAFVMVLVARR